MIGLISATDGVRIYYVYILDFNTDKPYIGFTTDIEQAFEFKSTNPIHYALVNTIINNGFDANRYTKLDFQFRLLQQELF